MRLPSKSVLLVIAALFAAAAIYISCNKGNSNSGATIIKCVTCTNGGSCINDTCRCLAGWEGITCQTESREKFEGQWGVFEKGSVSGAIAQYTIQIGESGLISSITSISLNGLYSDSLTFSYAMTGYINGDSIFIPTQQVSDYVFAGKGYINPGIVSPLSATREPGIITMRYQVTNVNTGVVNDFGYSTPADSPSTWIRN